MDSIFTNAMIVTPTGQFLGTLTVRDSFIAAIDTGVSSLPQAIDCGGDFLIPGLIDLHTDNLEKHFQPRPGVTWDAVGAAIAHDGQMAVSGVTTVYDSLSLYGNKGGFDRAEFLTPMIEGVDQARTNGLLRIDHKLHLRCEISTPAVIDTLNPHLDHPQLGLLSTTDHTPGQRQMRNVTPERLEEMLKASGRTPEEIERMRAEFADRAKADFRDTNRADVVDAAHRHHIPLASHDDETEQHVHMALAEGSTISEFPVTGSAALLAKQHGLHIIMGAPNLLRGGSHSGNVAVADIAQADALDALASDYLPISLIRAAFLLMSAPFHWPASKAIATVTAGPAAAVGLTDRGSLAPGKRADLVVVGQAGNGWPQIRAVWHTGDRVA